MEVYPTVDSSGKPMPKPSRPIDYGNKANTISFTSDSGATQARPRGKMKATFGFSYAALNLTQMRTLRTFFLARKGNVESFLWTDPVEKIQYTVKFAMDTFQANNFAYTVKGPLYSLEIKLEESL